MDSMPQAPLQAKPAIEMAMYDQNRVSGTNMLEAT